MRFVTMQWYFDSVLFKRSFYRVAPYTLDERLPLYLLGLLVFVPGGLVLAPLYRGRRRPEILATVILFVGFFLFQEYSSKGTGIAKRAVLGLRYFIPLLPVLAFAMAEVAPRLARRLLETGSPARRVVWQRALAAGLALWIGAVGVAAAVVHPAFSRWGATQVSIRDAIWEHVPADAVLVTNRPATRKFLRALESRFAPVDRNLIDPEDVDRGGENRGVRLASEEFRGAMSRALIENPTRRLVGQTLLMDASDARLTRRPRAGFTTALDDRLRVAMLSYYSSAPGSSTCSSTSTHT
jgi:hypothetical protein